MASGKSLPPGFARYFIALIPPSPIFEDVLQLKNYFREKYNSKASLNSPPHITLHMPFLWKKNKEDSLVKSLANFAAGQPPFEISLKGFGCFKPRVVFISVDESDQLRKMQQELGKFSKTKLNLFNAQYKEHPFHPHLTLAFRDLKKDEFTLAWEEFEEKFFSALFKVDQISLLKHDGQRWQELYKASF